MQAGSNTDSSRWVRRDDVAMSAHADPTIRVDEPWRTRATRAVGAFLLVGVGVLYIIEHIAYFFWYMQKLGDLTYQHRDAEYGIEALMLAFAALVPVTVAAMQEHRWACVAILTNIVAWLIVLVTDGVGFIAFAEAAVLLIVFGVYTRNAFENPTSAEQASAQMERRLRQQHEAIRRLEQTVASLTHDAAPPSDGD